MLVCSTKFQHLNIHKNIWMPHDRTIFNQIDHSVINGKHVSDILDVLTFRDLNRAITLSQQNYGCAFAHRGLRGLDAMKLRSLRTPKAFSTQLSDKLCCATSNRSDIGGLWTNISHSLNTTAKRDFGLKQPPQRNQWYDEVSTGRGFDGRYKAVRELDL